MTRLDEDTLFESYRIGAAIKEGLLGDEEAFVVRGARSMLAALRILNDADDEERHHCPGDGERGCMVSIPRRMKRCHFCAKTISLRGKPRDTL